MTIARSIARRRAAGLAAAALLTVAGAAHGQAAVNAPLIYSCVDAAGRRLTSDRPIVECSGREQRVLNPDGSVRRVLPAEMTAEERAAVEARERESGAERVRRMEAVRRDRNLLSRYPNEAAHRKMRTAALEDSRASLRESEDRLATLVAERKPLSDEAEFYAGKPLPLKLRMAISSNEASVEAQRSLVQNQRAEVQRIDRLYDVELDRLKRMWAGAPPGTLGPAVAAAAAAASGPAAPARK